MNTKKKNLKRNNPRSKKKRYSNHPLPDRRLKEEIT